MGLKDVLTDNNEKKLKGVLDSYVIFLKAIVKKAVQLILALGVTLVLYIILSWIYLELILPNLGFEKTLIVALIGVILSASKRN